MSPYCTAQMFDNIKKLEFGENNVDVIAIESAEGESIPLAKYPKARGEVEKWLSVLEQYMVLSLRRCVCVVLLQSYTRRLQVPGAPHSKSLHLESGCRSSTWHGACVAVWRHRWATKGQGPFQRS